MNVSTETIDEPDQYYDWPANWTYDDCLQEMGANENFSCGNFTEPFEENVLPWWRQLIWSILFGSMVIVATVGNLVVIWIVMAHKRMRTVTNYLLVNLSIADAMVSTLNVIPNYIYMLTSHWPFGELYCKIVQFVSVLCISASVFSLMAIAFDRYLAIMNPLGPRMGRKLILGIAVGIWIGGCLLSAPMLIFFRTFDRTLSDGSIIVFCYAEWPDGPQTKSYQEYLYNVFFMIFTYFVPMGVMGYTYTRIGIELWGSRSIGESTQRQLESIRSKRRVVKMMIVVVVIFGICWLPFHCYFIWISFWPEITHKEFVREFFLGIYWLAMSNSMYNPIIYVWLNNKFRRGFQQVFRWLPCVHYEENEGNNMTNFGNGMRRDRTTTTRYTVADSPTKQSRLARDGESAFSFAFSYNMKDFYSMNNSIETSRFRSYASGFELIAAFKQKRETSTTHIPLHALRKCSRMEGMTMNNRVESRKDKNRSRNTDIEEATEFLVP